MEEFVKGDVVVIQFPFSDLTKVKKRPALVVAKLEGDDLILCQITSKAKFDNYSIDLKGTDLKKGRLNVESKVRPNRLFTAEKSIIEYRIGSLKKEKLDEVIEKICDILRK